jgi:hypothetical protein
VVVGTARGSPIWHQPFCDWHTVGLAAVQKSGRLFIVINGAPDTHGFVKTEVCVLSYNLSVTYPDTYPCTPALNGSCSDCPSDHGRRTGDTSAIEGRNTSAAVARRLRRGCCTDCTDHWLQMNSFHSILSAAFYPADSTLWCPGRHRSGTSNSTGNPHSLSCRSVQMSAVHRSLCFPVRSPTAPQNSAQTTSRRCCRT